MTTVLMAFLLLAGVTFASPTAAPSWTPFRVGAEWDMRSSVNGHVTHFKVHHVAAYGCEPAGAELVDLVTYKQSPEDYWGPGLNAVGHQILRRTRDGGWRLVGSYADGSDAANTYTMQYHGYWMMPLPYLMIGARDSNATTMFYGHYAPGRVATDCLAGPAPTWGQHVWWRTSQTHDADLIRAHYYEGRCADGACQDEEWAYTPGVDGITTIADFRVGGVVFDPPMVLTRV